jgi:hypothetical protein
MPLTELVTKAVKIQDQNKVKNESKKRLAVVYVNEHLTGSGIVATQKEIDTAIEEAYKNGNS